MTTLTKTQAAFLKVGDRVCGDYGVTFTVTGVCGHGDSVSVTWHNGRTVYVSPTEVFYVETAAKVADLEPAHG